MTFEKDRNEMRKVYCELLMKTAETDDRIVVLEADLMASNGTKPFAAAYPERTFDVGIAEANMIGVAAGLAASGKIPFCDTFTPFATRRCYDQITVSAAYTNLPLRIVGTDPGGDGATHAAIEDVAIMRSMPNMKVFEPVDETQLRAAWDWILTADGPLYIRIFRKTAPKVFGEGYRFEPGKLSVVRDGKAAAIFATGLETADAMEAAELLKDDGIDAAGLNLHTLKPLDREGILFWAKKCGAAVTCENGTVVGGLGSAVAETTAEACPIPVKRIGVQDHFGEVWTMPYLKEKYGMTAGDIAKAVRAAIELKK